LAPRPGLARRLRAHQARSLLQVAQHVSDLVARQAEVRHPDVLVLLEQGTCDRVAGSQHLVGNQDESREPVLRAPVSVPAVFECAAPEQPDADETALALAPPASGTTLGEVELATIRQALDAADGNISLAAKRCTAGCGGKAASWRSRWRFLRAPPRQHVCKLDVSNHAVVPLKF
jgi:hypothetical protein